MNETVVTRKKPAPHPGRAGRLLGAQTNLTWKKWVILLGMAPAVLFYLIFGIYPSLMTAVYSFTDISGVPNAAWKFIGLANYKEFFLLQNYRDTVDTLVRTLVFSFSVTLIQNFFALLVAVLLNDKALKGRNFYRAIVFLPTVLGVTIVCYAWSLFFTLDGPASTILSWFGGFSAFLGDQVLAFPLVIFIQIWMSLGYAMVIYLAGLQAIPLELNEAGLIDGASPRQIFRHITLPLLWPTVSVNALLSVIGSLSVVQTILLTTAGGNNTSTLAMRIFSTAFGIGTGVGGSGQSTMRQGYASAQSMVLFAIILIFTIIVQYVLNRREKE